jgi:hypothetical protein
MLNESHLANQMAAIVQADLGFALLRAHRNVDRIHSQGRTDRAKKVYI